MITKVNPSIRRRAQSLQFPCPVRICHCPDLTWHFLIWKTPRSLVGTALYVGQDRPETQYATKEAARFMSGPTRAAKCMLKRWCKFYSEAPVLSWSFPYQEMPSEIRAVTDANWAGELEGLRSTSCGWIYFGDHLLVTYSSTQQIVALSTAESENISITKGAANPLEVRCAMVEFGMTCVGWTGSGHETWCRPRASLGCAIVVAAAIVRRKRG